MGKRADPIKIIFQSDPDPKRLWEIVAELLGAQEDCSFRVLKKEQK